MASLRQIVALVVYKDSLISCTQKAEIAQDQVQALIIKSEELW